MLAWSTEQVPGQPELHRETLSQNKNQKRKKQKQAQNTGKLGLESFGTKTCSMGQSKESSL